MGSSSVQPSYSMFSLSYDSSPFTQGAISASPSSAEYYTPLIIDEECDEYTQSNYFTEAPIQPETNSSETIALESISISTSFHLGVIPAPDIYVSSSDGVVFCVNAPRILQTCPTAFKDHLSLLDPSHGIEIINVDCPSQELGIVFHALYGTAPTAQFTNILDLVRAIDRMPEYGLVPANMIQSATPLYNLLLLQAPLRPLDVYALAARDGLKEVAILVSSNLLSYDISTMTDEIAQSIGAIYLNKLVLLQKHRSNALKAIMLRSPYPHPPTDECGFEEQKEITRIWALASAHMAWDTNIDLTAQRLREALNLGSPENLTCSVCGEVLQRHAKDAIAQWMFVNRTI